jgi:type IV pilus assembly protein PilC
MKMLLEAGSPLVPALEATASQTTKPAMRALVSRLRERVEEGETLAGALDAEPHSFDPVFRSMVAAGEATAALPEVFGRLCDLCSQQLQTRKMVVGALLYPVILMGLLLAVVLTLLLFVVPRFETLFTSLNSSLPATTEVLFTASVALRSYWPAVTAGAVLLVGGVIGACYLPGARRTVDALLIRLPVVGPLVTRIIFARVVRVWAAMLRCHVQLLDAIEQSREAITNHAFLEMIDQVGESVSSGGRMGEALAATRLADPIIVSALRTGEDNGRLGDAADFVSTWLDEDNATAVQHITRMAEPLLLAVMGIVVGFVAMALFLPLFDLASAAG